MNKELFLKIFNSLRDCWVPSLDLSFEAEKVPVVETKTYITSSKFTVQASSYYQVSYGNCGFNCQSLSEVDREVNSIIDAGCNGRSEVLNNKLQHKISKTKLIDLYNLGRFPLGNYTYKCLIECDDCHGSGTETCSNCNGSGSVQEPYQAHVRDNLSYHNGRVTSRNPVYETRYRRVNCGRCHTTGRVSCSTCGGDGVNTHIETVEFYSSHSTPKIEWQNFDKLTWVEAYIKGKNSEDFNIDEAVDWQFTNQVVQESGGPGSYTVSLPGTLTASECNLKACSLYTGATYGNCKALGIMVCDTDYIFDDHIKWSSDKKSKIALTGKSLTPILKNKIVEDCLEDMSSTKVPKGKIKSLNMVSSETIETLQELMNKVLTLNKEERESVSVPLLMLNTFLSLILLTGLLYWLNTTNIIGDGFNFGIYPILANSIDATKILGSIIFSGYYDMIFFRDLFIMFLASMTMMFVFGAKKAFSIIRVLKWYLFGMIFILSFMLQFANLKDPTISSNANNDFMDLFIFSLFAGILFTRKMSYGKQMKYAKEYNSNKLLQLLGYVKK
ncbi:hypothetical protein [Marinomonas algarum]|uniref:Uncharacterized protein n=1 Tax=Marinomonas algarum TaxID=2883105 RepID=A0A9X1LF46_9GAMM|nr:hypothetical protein [Marinomonas algarum]MCB5162596.1 hypothetical protein [Marinomonas algarum]